MAAALPFVAAAAMVTSAIGQAQSGVAQRQMATRQAELEEQAGADRARDIRQHAKYSEGSLRAGYAAAGVDPDQGSALDVSLKNATEYELDAMRALRGATARGQYIRFGGKQAERAGYIGAGASLLGGASMFGSGLGGGKKPQPTLP